MSSVALLVLVHLKMDSKDGLTSILDEPWTYPAENAFVEGIKLQFG